MKAKSEPTKATRKPPTRRVHGRVRADALGGHWVVELRKDLWDFASGSLVDAGGVTVRRRGRRRSSAERLPFAALVAGGGVEHEVDGLKLRFRWSDAGVEVRRQGLKEWRTVTWSELNRLALARGQPELFNFGKAID